MPNLLLLWESLALGHFDEEEALALEEELAQWGPADASLLTRAAFLLQTHPSRPEGFPQRGWDDFLSAVGRFHGLATGARQKLLEAALLCADDRVVPAPDLPSGRFWTKDADRVAIRYPWPFGGDVPAGWENAVKTVFILSLTGEYTGFQGGF